MHFIVSFDVGFAQLDFLWLIEFSFKISFKPKTWLLVAIAPNKACRLTCCHVPFKGLFPLEKHFPFCGLVRVATRS